ncbi:MAG: menaquinone biosynthesis protein [Acidobacteria bacterium]|nr:menaquinone biosynthesis protein [Acidobacteriota bacterium]
MDPRPPRISASSYSNTAPLIWSFLYGSQHGKVELILDNAPARSVELLAQKRVDAALTPVIAYQSIDDVFLIPDVCVGAKERVRSVCLATRGMPLEQVRSVALDVSSKTSVCLTKIIFREFLGFEPEWREARPDIDAMLAESDCALLIGDPALRLTASRANSSDVPIETFDLAELWRKHTGLGFVFAMWMARASDSVVDFAAVRDEGLKHIDEIAANYVNDISLPLDELKRYLTENISYGIDDAMQAGLELYFELAFKNGLIGRTRPLEFAG